MRRDVRGRVAIVTGGSRGIGRRVAEGLAAAGAKIALTARSAGELDDVAAGIRAAGGTCEVFPADLTDPAARARLVAAAAEKFGGIDLLVNSAGVCSFGEFQTSTPRVLRTITEINFFAPAELIRLCYPHLARSYEAGHRPAVANVASLCGRVGIPSMSEHSGSKHAFVGLTEAIRAEFARAGIDVILLVPGLVRSDDLDRHLLRNEGRISLDFANAQTADDAAAAIVRTIQTNRRETAVGRVAWGVWLGKRLWPRGVRWFLRRKCEKFERRAAGR